MKEFTLNEVLVWQTIVLIVGIIMGIALGWYFCYYIPSIFEAIP